MVSFPAHRPQTSRYAAHVTLLQPIGSDLKSLAQNLVYADVDSPREPFADRFMPWVGLVTDCLLLAGGSIELKGIEISALTSEIPVLSLGP